MWRLLTVVALTAGTATTAVAQEPEPTTREAAIEQEQAEKAKNLHPYTPGKTRRAAQQSRGHPGQRGAELAPVLRQRVLGRRLHARRRLRASRHVLQPARRARQLYDHGLQANRSGVHRASSVPSSRLVVAPRRLARGDTGRPSTALGWTRRQTIVRTSSFRQPYGSATLTFWPDPPSADAARRPGAVPVVAAAR